MTTAPVTRCMNLLATSRVSASGHQPRFLPLLRLWVMLPAVGNMGCLLQFPLLRLVESRSQPRVSDLIHHGLFSPVL